MTPAELAPLVSLPPAGLAAHLAALPDPQAWIDDVFDVAEEHDAGNGAGLHDLAYACNDIALLLKDGVEPEAIRNSPYRGMVGDWNEADELPAYHRPDRTAAGYVPPLGFVVGPAGELMPELGGIEAGMESLREQHDDAPRFQLLTVADLRALEPLRWRVRGILPTEGLAALYGPPGCGKSFLALDMLAAIAEGRTWFDHATTAAPCVYVGLEGEAGVAQRVQAYCTKHDAPDRLRVVLTPLDLRRHDDREELASAIREAGMADGVVAIDTLNRAAPGIDENDASSMGLLIDAAKDLRERLGGLVLLVHHAGKDVARGLRGHSSLLAALDAVIEVTREGDRRGWQLAKAKDAGDDESRPFRLDVVELGEDADGWPVSSCIVMPEAPAGETVRNSKVPKGGNQRIVWDGLGEMLRESKTFGQGGAPALRPCIRLDDAIEKLRDRLACEPNRRTPRTREAITGLVNRGLVELREDWLWCK